ncbi:amino-acid N-acetyltransferase [Powellomyces hirtus]|uniref:Amino-acid acetyltransferase, mitochondrial n=1 Tax=Powellomyces hirtus TaxID=109895 RepID=A0A507E9Y5_9FUNG|nr:amino-acid N-acetyltransferase [Powellomyces hirtus]
MRVQTLRCSKTTLARTLRSYTSRSNSAKNNNGPSEYHYRDSHPSHPTPQVPRPVPADRQLILDILGTKPSQREARQFLKRFNQVPGSKKHGDMHYRDLRPAKNPAEVLLGSMQQQQQPGQLGMISLQNTVSEGQLAQFAGTLVHLQKLGLMPIIVLEDATTAEHGSSDFRIVQEAGIKRLFRLVDLIDAAGGRGMGLYNGIFSQTSGHTSSLSSSPEPPLADNVHVDLSPVHVALGLGQIPVLATFSFDQSHSRTTVLSSCDALVALSKALASDKVLTTPLKTILVNQRGGLAVDPANPIGFVNLEDEFADVRESITARITDSNANSNDEDHHRDLASQLRDLDTARSILTVLPSSSSAIITSVASSAALISNLITDKPPNPSTTSLQSMTFDYVPRSKHDHHRHNTPIILPTVLRHGLRVAIYKSTENVDLDRLSTLLEQSFQKHLEAEPFWERMSHVLDNIIVAGNYDGAAIVTQEPDPFDRSNTLPYLDKFAVAPTSQGIGVADILWKQLRKQYPNLSWRSRASNPVNKWYFERCEGNLRLHDSVWQLFWYGDDGVAKLRSYEEMARNVPASFSAKQ